MTPSRKTNIQKPHPGNEPLLFREQLSLLLECLPIIPFVCDAKDPFRILFIHPAVQTIAGYSPEAVTGNPDFWKAHIHPEDQSMALDKLPESCNACDSPLEYRLQQVIQADKLASLGEMVAGVAHEINNPNSFITYNMPLLEETWLFLKPIITGFSKTHPEWQTAGLRIPELCQDMEEMIQAIRIGSDRITKVVTSLKDFARMDQSAATRPVCVNDVIEKTMVIVGGQLRKAASQIKMELSPNLPEIQGHLMKLEQVVANLLLNAANALPAKEKGRISIATRYIHRIQSVLIEVEDNGAGMKPGIMDRIFEPFFTTRRDTGGTGLGLSLSYGLIKEHSGRIGVLSRPGIGTRFTVYLPVNKDCPVELRPTILCVDDDPGVLSMLSKYFVSVKNIPLETLARSEEVLGYIENHPEVDIVISDIVMPGINGWDLLTQIKHKYPLITVILFSGDPNQLETKPDHAPRPDYLFPKPVPLKSLLESINTIGRQKL